MRLLVIVGIGLSLHAAQASAGTYPQLLSTRYEAGPGLPADFARPVARFDFVATDKLPAGAKVLSAARSGGGRVWVVTDRGAFRSDGDVYEPLEVGPGQLEPGQPPVKASQVVAVAADAVGHVWLATNRGLYITDGEQWWQSLDRRDGVPYEAMTCLHLARNGDVWGGTNEGAWRLRDGQFRYFWGLRWLPDNHVRHLVRFERADVARD
jgi:ligand-binding sensor domain-containing protein